MHNNLMKLTETIKILEAIVPIDYAEEWDNVGLLINPLYPHDTERILLTIDLTESVAEESIKRGADLIVAYHPILFRPVKRLDACNAYDRTVLKLVKNDIAVYSPHTALDVMDGGVNDWLAEGVGEGEVSILHPINNSGIGQGRLVELNDAVELNTLVTRVKQHLGLNTLRIAPSVTGNLIRTVALCAGAGGDVLKDVKADCYLTGEMNHHSILALTSNGAHAILCEHTNTERGYLPVFARTMKRAMGTGVDILISERDADPIQIN